MVKPINPWTHTDPNFGEVPLGHAFVFKPKEMMILSGQVSEDPDTKEIIGTNDLMVQYRQVHENIKRVLEAGGFTLRDVVKRAAFVSEEGFNQMKEKGLNEQLYAVMKEFFPKPYPPHTFWVAKSLAHPDFLVEMEVIAAKE